MDGIDYLVIKLTSEDGSGSPIGVVESPPMLWLTLKERNPGFSWSYPPIASEVEQFGYGLFEWAQDPSWDIQYDKNNYTKSYRPEGVTKHDDGVWRSTWTQIDASSEEIEKRTNDEKLKITNLRNRLLKLSDFSQGVDAPDYVKAKQSEWNAYRQALRDLPSQQGFPWEVTIPTKPSK